MSSKVVIVPVKGNPSIEDFNAKDSYTQISTAVGGYIETVILPAIKHTGDYEVTCFVNEEGLLKGLPLNSAITVMCEKSYGGPIVGDAIFVGTDGAGDTVGLAEEDAKEIIKNLTEH